MSPIPKTAPFADEEIDLLNRVVGTATPVQRAWLAGFLAGLDASGGTPAVHPAAPARPAEPLTIVYASESGNSEKLAGDIAKAARKNGLKPTIIDMADLDLAALTSAKKLVFIAATNHDRKIRAFDKATGALLWEATMPSSGNATPATYEVDGRQYLVVAAGGGKSPNGGPGGIYVAFALPQAR